MPAYQFSSAFTTFIICASNNITNINRSKFKIFE